MKYMVALSLFFCVGVATMVPSTATDIAASVLTQHNDNHRSGAYLRETQLTPATVGGPSFGRVGQIDVDGVVSAQPLVVAGLNLRGTPTDAVFVATNNNSIFRISRNTLTKTWESSLLWHMAGAVTLPGMLPDQKLHAPHKPCLQTRWPVGIVSTPVIDAATNRLYFVYRVGVDYSNVQEWPATINAHWYLAAIDIVDGHTVIPAVEISDKDGQFAPAMQLNRPGLLLANGTIYAGFAAAVCDSGGNPNIEAAHKAAWHGWVFAYNAATLQRLASFNTSPGGNGSGIWQSGNGLAGGADGSVYATTGNNSPRSSNDAPGLSESFLRLRLQSNGTFAVSPQRTGNFARLDTGLPHPSDPTTQSAEADSDLGAGGPLILPNGLITGGGKQGSLYVIGSEPGTSFRQGFQAFFNSWHSELDPCDYDSAQSYGPNLHGAPVYWHPQGSPFTLLYGMPEKEYLTAFRVDAAGAIQEHPSLTTVDTGVRSPDGMPGGFLSISANGGTNGILWASVGKANQPDGSAADIQGRLVAFDATNLRKLWSDDTQRTFTKFVPPTIADGYVFRAVTAGALGAYHGRIIVYGLTNTTGDAPRTHGPVVHHPPIREVSALWRNPNHLDLFAATFAAGDVVSNSIGNPRGTPPEFPGCPTGWREWFPVGTNGRIADAARVTALWQNASRLDLFTTTRSGAIVTASWKTTQPPAGRWQEQGWQGVPNAPTAAAGTSVTALWRTTLEGDPQHLDLFTAAGGAVQSTWDDAAGWHGWFPVGAATGKPASGAPITALWRNANHLDLFMSDIAGHVVSTYFENNTWQPGWFPLMPATGIAKPGAPITAVWRDSGHLDLFMTDIAGHVVSTYFENNAWQPGWFALDPVNLVAAPGEQVTAKWRDHDHLDLFLVDANGVVRSTYFENNTWQPHWFSVGSVRAAPGQPVTALWRDNTHLDLFLSAIDGRIMSAFWERAGSWRDWFVI